jgi:tetratricopeptide (TPR) repeat protein
MFRRLQTRGLPGLPETASRPLFWDFRLDGEPPRWTFELQAWASGAWRAPEQAAWLQERGLPVPQPNVPLPLDTAQLEAITAALAPAAEVTWEAMELHAQAVALAGQGEARAALERMDELMGLAPAWIDAKLLQITLLIQVERDPDGAEAALAELPRDQLPAAQRRSLRQSIALLREDWDGYAAEVRAIIDEGDTSWFHFEVLGLSLWAAGHLDAAAAALSEGLALHPGLRDLELRRVEVWDAAGRREEALAALDALLAPETTEESRSHAKTWALRGWLRRETDAEGSAADTERALALDPNEAVARVCRGVGRMEEGDIQGARADLKPFSHCGWAAAAEAWNTFVAQHGTEDDRPNTLVDGAQGEVCGLPHDHDHHH